MKVEPRLFIVVRLRLRSPREGAGGRHACGIGRRGLRQSPSECVRVTEPKQHCIVARNRFAFVRPFTEVHV